MSTISDANKIDVKNLALAGQRVIKVEVGDSVEYHPIGLSSTEPTAGGTATADATATAADILYDKTAYVNGEKITGTITTVTGTIEDNIVTIPKGYIAEDVTYRVEEASYPTVSGNTVTVHKGYSAGDTVTVGTAKDAETYTPSTTNQTIPSGVYTSGVQTIQGDSKLVASNIRQGVSIFGVSGTYTSDATAGVGDIITGKTAYVNGTKITGTIENKGTVSITPTTEEQSLGAGYYSGITVSAMYADIQFGYINADGNFQEVDLTGDAPVDTGDAIAIDAITFYTGKNNPEYEGGGGSAIYECAAVAETTWSGYEMVWQKASGDTPAGYVKSETLTEGLEIKGYTPKIGNIYNADTTIEVRQVFDGSTIPITQDGLVFYAPLQEDYVDKISGTAATVTGGTFTTHNGIKALQLDGLQSAIWYSLTDVPSADADYSLVILYSPIDQSNWRVMFSIGCAGDSQNSIRAYSGRLLNTGGYLTDNIWQSIVMTKSNNTYRLYVNGVSDSSGSLDATMTFPVNVCVGAEIVDGGNGGAMCNGYFASSAIYNRELSAAEVLEIHNALMEGVQQ